MYTKEELGQAKRAILIMSKRNNVPEEQIRTALKDAINASFYNSDPQIQAQWAECEFTGSEPTPEEFITWLAKKVKKRA